MLNEPADPPIPSSTFCVLPWVHVFGDELGRMRPCCIAREGSERKNTDDHGRHHVVYRDLAQGWNSPFMRALRQDMLQGRPPEVCTRCFQHEALSIRSSRQHSNVVFAPHIEGAIAATGADGSVPLDRVRSLDVRLGNVCNLRCRMCSPVSTKLLIPEFRTLFGLAEDDAWLLALEHVDWFASAEFRDSFERLLPGLERLHFAGGEPLLIDSMLDLLARVVESGRAGSIVLSYVTNGTTLPDRVRHLWAAFAEVRLVVSLDGFGALNEFIRYPSRWDRVEANIRRLADEPRAFNCTAVSFNTTVQAYNVLALTDLFEYLFTHTARHIDPYPRLSLLYEPAPLSIRVLPADVRALAASRLRAFVSDWEGRAPRHRVRWNAFTHAIEGVIEHMLAVDASDALPEFVRRTTIFDRSRGQDVRTVLPELAPIFDHLAVDTPA